MGNMCQWKYELSSSSSDRKKLDTMRFHPGTQFLTIPRRLQHQLQIVKPSYRGCSKLIEVPDSIGNLKNLRELSLRECVMIESLPPSIWKLKNVEILDLSSTRILELPKEIGNLENLREFQMTSCRRIKTLPSSIGRLKKLEKLLLPRTCITHLPNEIGELSNLKILSLFGITRLEPLPPSVRQLNKLEKLDLDITRLLESSQEIGKLENLRWLSVSLDENQFFTRRNTLGDLVKQFLIKLIHSCPKLGTVAVENETICLKREDRECLQLHLALNRARQVPETLLPLLISKPKPKPKPVLFDDYCDWLLLYSFVNREVVYQALVEGSVLFSLAISRGQRKSQPKPNAKKGN